MGSNRCGCGHRFFGHGPDGCRVCNCTTTRGGLFPSLSAPSAPGAEARPLPIDSETTPYDPVELWSPEEVEEYFAERDWMRDHPDERE